MLSDLQKPLRSAELQVNTLKDETDDACVINGAVESQVSSLTLEPLQDFSSDLDLSSSLKNVCEKIEHQNTQLRLGLGSAQRALRVILNPSEVTFDPDTIHPNLVLSEDLKTVSFSVAKQPYPAVLRGFPVSSRLRAPRASCEENISGASRLKAVLGFGRVFTPICPDLVLVAVWRAALDPGASCTVITFCGRTRKERTRR